MLIYRHINMIDIKYSKPTDCNYKSVVFLSLWLYFEFTEKL